MAYDSESGKAEAHRENMEEYSLHMRNATDTPTQASDAVGALERASTVSANERSTTVRKETNFPRLWRQVRAFAKIQWFVISLGLLILLASQVQVPLAQQHVKQTVVSYLCVSIIFLVTGCTLSTQVLIKNYSRWRIHLFVQVQCFLLTSSVVFGISSACAAKTSPAFMDGELLVGLVLLGCVPTTIASNVFMTTRAGGNTELTVVESTIGNFLGPFLTPLLLKMYLSAGAWYTDFLPAGNGDNYAELYSRVFMQLGLTLFLPMFVGQVLRWLFPDVIHTIMVTWRVGKLGGIALLVILWAAFDSAFATHALTSVPASNVLFLVFGSIGLFILFLTICVGLSLLWLPDDDLISVAYCVPAKTPAIGIPLTQVLFIGLTLEQLAKIQIPMVIYQGLQVTAGSILTTVFKSWALRRRKKSSSSSVIEQTSKDLDQPSMRETGE